ncbi:Gfo/Idh/MocA family protein [Cellulomonas fimi]|uniref:Gfo/Idh/MocA family oxidoreductase n=1 Tax=Cellulomonas fimi TaxID=1708 RepID=A0A7Y0QG51_CELFI|nr:Gfo/Idh/MocA family oxidoreductase [Cellulomonas fimi]NMR18738.1 Gfo/Idh/MocA family oxidoreductase [Cellulomonas fimi]
MTELRVGLLGPSGIGATHATAIARTDGVRLVAVAGGRPETGRTAAERYGTPWFTDLDAMLADDDAALDDDTTLDVVVVCSSNDDHVRAASSALAAGVHVLVEKPLATTLADAEALVRAADEAAARGVVAALVSQRRFEAAHQHLAGLLRSGALGRVLVVSGEVLWWRPAEYFAAAPWRTAHPTGGSLINQGVHTLDLMLWLAGPAVEVRAVAGRVLHGTPAEDVTAVALRHASGAVGSLVTSTAARPGGDPRLTLVTEAGTVELVGSQVARWDVDAEPPPPDDVPAGGARPDGIGTVGHERTWQDLVGAIREHRAPAVTFHDGLEAVRVIDAVYRAAPPAPVTGENA